MLNSLYYERNASTFYQATVNRKLDQIYNRFLRFVPKKANILDAGCGSGRDTKAFLKRGYKVTSIDSSKALAEMASRLTGNVCHVRGLEELCHFEEFDAVWASASLLHISYDQIGEVLIKLEQALKKKGAIYMSLKKGDGCEVVPDGRHFIYYQLNEFEDIINEKTNLTVICKWKTVATDSHGKRCVWLNYIALKN